MKMDKPEENRDHDNTQPPIIFDRDPLGPPGGVDVFDPNVWRKFFSLTGGSLLYCLSAVLVAFGVVKVLGPILAGSTTLAKAMPCIATLHLYELSLLAVLILLVYRKVVDDAISLAIIAVLFMVGTSIAQGSVAEKDISVSLPMAGIGAALALAKLCAMRRFARIAFGWMSILGLSVLVAGHYIVPAFLARSVSVAPSHELVRKELWMFLWWVTMASGGLILAETLRRKDSPEQAPSSPLLRRPAMACILALILLVASGVQQYAMAYTFGLERRMGDFAPLVTLSALLFMAIFRSLGKRFGALEVILACFPAAFMLWTIAECDISSTGRFGFGLLSYPPMFFALSGLALALVSMYCRWQKLSWVILFYAMGIILTWGYSRAHPYDLNISATLWTLAAILLCYGLVMRNQFPYLAGLIAMCIQVARITDIEAVLKTQALTVPGTVAGICGTVTLAYCLLFGSDLLRPFRVVGGLCLALFLYDYMPNDIHWRHLIALVFAGCLATGLWFRVKDKFLVAILAFPFAMKLYLITRRLAYWRVVIMGFLFLAVGALASLRKAGAQPTPPPEEQHKTT
jgi:hypothetical protein